MRVVPPSKSSGQALVALPHHSPPARANFTGENLLSMAESARLLSMGAGVLSLLGLSSHAFGLDHVDAPQNAEVKVSSQPANPPPPSSSVAALTPIHENQRTVRTPRPRWRLVVGSLGLVSGSLFAGFGISALSVRGSCIGQSQTGECPYYYGTESVGTALLSVGGFLTFSGVMLLALPGLEQQPEMPTGQ